MDHITDAIPIGLSERKFHQININQPTINKAAGIRYTYTNIYQYVLNILAIDLNQ